MAMHFDVSLPMATSIESCMLYVAHAEKNTCDLPRTRLLRTLLVDDDRLQVHGLVRRFPPLTSTVSARACLTSSLNDLEPSGVTIYRLVIGWISKVILVNRTFLFILDLHLIMLCMLVLTWRSFSLPYASLYETQTVIRLSRDAISVSRSAGQI